MAARQLVGESAVEYWRKPPICDRINIIFIGNVGHYRFITLLWKYPSIPIWDWHRSMDPMETKNTIIKPTTFQSQIIKGLEKRTSPKINKKLTLLQLYMHQLKDQRRLDSLMGPAVAGSTDGTGCGDLLIGPVVTAVVDPGISRRGTPMFARIYTHHSWHLYALEACARKFWKWRILDYISAEIW